MNLKDRSRWIIDFIVKKDKLSNQKIADDLNIDVGRVNSYRTKRAYPKTDFIGKFCNKYKISHEWYAWGDGEPFAGAREEYPEVCGPPINNDVEKAAGYVGEKGTLPVSEGEEYILDPFGQASTGLREIFNSKDIILISAIQANIRAFQLSIRRERQIQQQANEIISLKKKCDILENENKDIKERLAALEERFHPGEPTQTESSRKAAI